MAYYDCECDSFEMTEGLDAFEMNEGIPGPGVPAGGTAGQYLKKASSTDYDAEWDTLTAGDVAFNKESGYVSGTVGRYLQLLDSEDVQYTYGGEKELGTVGKTLDYLADKSVEIEEALDDLDDSLDDLKNTLNHKADAIYDTASGDIASFPDGADGLPLKDLTVGIEPVQNLHGYDNPWPAGGGKNKLNPYVKSGTVSDVNISVSADGKVTASGTSSNTVYYSIVGANNADLLSLPAGEYIVSGANSKCRIRIADSNNTFINSGDTFTFTADGNGNVVQLLIASGTVVNDTIYPMIRLSTVSDATFAPYSNICPISGWTGCNVNATGKNICMDTGYRQGVLGWNEEKPVDVYTNGHYISSPFIEVAGGETITITSHGWIVRYYELDKDGNSLFFTGTPLKDSSSTRTLPNNCKYIIFSIGDDNNYYTPSDYGTALYCQIEYGDTATPYEPFGTTLPISWQSSAGTVYGGTLDVTSGVLTVTMASIAMDSISWSTQTIGSVNAFQGDLGKVNVRGNIAKDDSYFCTCYKYICDSRAVLENNNCAFTPWNQTTSYDLALRDDRFSTAEALTTALAGEMLVYELKTPIIIQLDPVTVTTLLGQNNIWSDTGAVLNCKYPCDTKLYIERLTAPEEDDMVANQNIASGVYFMVGNNLYLSTATITAGETIVPGTGAGTNCTATNLAAALNALNT